MILSVEAQKHFGAFALDAGFTSAAGVTALFGRSGSGKTTLLRVIAGLARPDIGRLTFEDAVLVDTQRKVFVPVHQRRFGYIFQDSRLFPHLSVRNNLNFGSWFTSRKRPADFDHIVHLLGIEALLDRKPHGLSGGERQRVAIGRALLASPRLLLMDEPLAALDDARKSEILPYLEKLRDEMKTPMIYVSHSVAEVTRLADRVIVLADGKIEAAGSPAEVLASPSIDQRDTGVIISGTVASSDAQHRVSHLTLRAGEVILPAVGLERGRRVNVHIAERDVLVAVQQPEGLSALNILKGYIIALEPQREGTIRVRIDAKGDILLARVTTLSVDRLGLTVGQPIFAVIKAMALIH
jgi:molybdenum ABC transporter, ATP-binding protein